MKEATLNWNRVVDEMAVMSPDRLKTLLGKLGRRRRQMARRTAYAGLAKLTFDDIGSSDEWIAVENEALQHFESSLDAHK